MIADDGLTRCSLVLISHDDGSTELLSLREDSLPISLATSTARDTR